MVSLHFVSENVLERVRAHLVLLDSFHRNDVNFVLQKRRENSSTEKFCTRNSSNAFVLVFSLEVTLVSEVASSVFVDEVENF